MNRETEGVVPAFTVSQWQELEHQALIYKYLLAGLPVPPDLVTLIQNNISSSNFFHRPSSSLGYSYCSRESSLYGYGYGYGYRYGKKLDPEPGRCRRTDGKKWRCSKEAHPDSKYCERHMNRGRNRSRKPVESQSLSSSSNSSLTSPFPYVSASSRTQDQTQSLQLDFSALGSVSSNDISDRSEFRLDSIPYAIPTKPYSRHLQGCKPEASEHRSYAQSSGGNRSLLMDTALDNKWPTMSPQMPSFSPSKSMDNSSLHYDYSRQSYVNCDSGPSQPGKQSSQSLQSFFEVWPNTKESWSGLEDDGTNQVTFSTRQLSISIPKTTSDLSSSPQSPQEQ